MTCPFTFRYEVFCPECSKHIRFEDKKTNEATCTDCRLDLAEYLRRNMGRILVFPIATQIQNYLGDPNFTSILRIFSFYKHGKVNGPLHQEIFTQIHMSLRLGIDAAPLTREGSSTVYPAALHLNNVPLSLQHRYPILAALYVGPTHAKPTPSRMLDSMQKELKDLATCPLSWKDDRNQVHRSCIYLTMAHSDLVEKKDLQNMVAHNSKSSCNLCIYEGEDCNVETQPTVYTKENQFKQTKADTSSGVR
jgi:hypothetical protein